MWYGSSVLRHGRSRPFLRYHASRLRRKRCRNAGAGTRVRALWQRPYNPTVKIYTKTGDTGDTSLFDGTRVRKTDPRVVAYGDVDELQACLGMVRAAGLPADLDEMCLSLQRDLFALGARLADPTHKIAKRVEKIVIDDESIDAARGLDRRARYRDSAAAALHPVGRLPGRRGAALRAHRVPPRGALDAALGADAVEPIVIVYMNRLSDLLFTMARAANHRAGATETPW